MTAIKTRRLVAMAFVADVQRSAAFYEQLGFSIANTFTPPDSAAPSWAWLESGEAQLMVSRASEPVVPEQQAVLFYLYVDDVAATREALASAGLIPGPITTPFYAPLGEFRLVDPDGYCLMITHV
ncbi:MAG: VOC family protein [Pyrinomonadaceae bacterium]